MGMNGIGQAFYRSGCNWLKFLLDSVGLLKLSVRMGEIGQTLKVGGIGQDF